MENMDKEVGEVSNNRKRLTRTNAVVSMSKSKTEMDQINGDDIQNQTDDGGHFEVKSLLIQMTTAADDDEKEEEEEKFDDKEVDLIKEVVGGFEEEREVNQTWDKKVKAVMDFHLVDPDVSPNVIRENKSKTKIRIQSFVDLLMWKDMSRSAVVFGIGVSLIITSFFTKTRNFRLISAGSYLGLLYLAAIFIYKSFVCRGVELDFEEQRFHIREEDAIWFVKLVLPFIDEIVIKLRSIFSGDPEITMKVGLLLFVLARFGGVISIWTMTKLAFIGAFTIPKLYSSYSYEIVQYGHFYMERCIKAWMSCSQKKAVAAISFVLFWNLCSSMDRFWTLFMLAAALRYYQKSGLVISGWSYGQNQEKVEEDEYSQKHKQRGEVTGEESTEGEVTVKVVNVVKQENKKVC